MFYDKHVSAVKRSQQRRRWRDGGKVEKEGRNEEDSQTDFKRL